MLRLVLSISALVLASFVPLPASAHCDTPQGPVLTAARKALDSGNVNLALIWVQPRDEGRIRDAFARARAKDESRGPDAASTREFFETLVRLHREGEGATYSGIQPADADLGPAAPEADKALELGNVDGLQAWLSDQVKRGITTHFRQVVEKKLRDPNDLVAGRAYVSAYVNYTHYVERLYQTANDSSLPGLEHDERAPATVHGHALGHAGQGHSAAHAHGHAGQGHSAGHAGHLPWLVAGLFGLAMVGQTSWIVIRWRRPKP